MSVNRITGPEATGATPTNRMHGRNFFLTWISEANRQDVLTQLKARHQTDYVLVCEELCPKTGRHHLHAVVVLSVTLRTRDFSVWDIYDENGRVSADVGAIKSLERSIAYAKKGHLWIEDGINPLAKRRMERREKLRYIQEHSLHSIIESGEFTLGEVKNAQIVKEMLRREEKDTREWIQRDVLWFYGPTGTGKTREAVRIVTERHGRNWVTIMGDMKRFLNGYDCQEGVILDELRSDKIDFSFLLSLTDGYPVTVQIKGSTRIWKAKTIIITAPVPPRELFFNHVTEQPWDGIEQLLRRINEVREFTPAIRPNQLDGMSIETQGFFNDRDSVLDREPTISSIRPMSTESPVINLPITYPEDPELRKEQDDKYQ